MAHFLSIPGRTNTFLPTVVSFKISTTYFFLTCVSESNELLNAFLHLPFIQTGSR